jgi:hypothetical protein
MENNGQIVRSKKNGKSRYTAISNEILQSKILEPEEKSILVHLLSLPEDWVVYKTQIWKDMNIGRDRFNKHWVGLVNKGYIVSIQIVKSNGQIDGYNHIVYENPVLPGSEDTNNQPIKNKKNNLITENQVTEIQYTGNQVTGSQGVNKVITKQSNNKQSNKLQSNKLKKNNIEINNSTLDNIGKIEDNSFFDLNTTQGIELYVKSINKQICPQILSNVLDNKNFVVKPFEEKVVAINSMCDQFMNTNSKNKSSTQLSI